MERKHARPSRFSQRSTGPAGIGNRSGSHWRGTDSATCQSPHPYCTQEETMQDTFVGIQVGPQSLYDEGIDHALDLMQETAGVNTLIAYTHTYYGANNRPAEVFAPDHGSPVHDERRRKLPGVW